VLLKCLGKKRGQISHKLKMVRVGYASRKKKKKKKKIVLTIFDDKWEKHLRSVGEQSGGTEKKVFNFPRGKKRKKKPCRVRPSS